MSSQQAVQYFFEAIAFLFAISVHESAHAWMADRCGDPTAKMLGRITLNPIKHIDIFGTIILPLIALVSGFPMIGWAKPTPVDTRNFKDPVRQDILTSLAGPASNLIVAVVSVLLLVVIKRATHGSFGEGSALEPVVILLYQGMVLNVLLAVFNCIPIPPLDGSHVLRHFLPESLMRSYQIVGMIALVALFIWGGPVINFLMAPFLNFFDTLLKTL